MFSIGRRLSLDLEARSGEPGRAWVRPPRAGEPSGNQQRAATYRSPWYLVVRRRGIMQRQLAWGCAPGARLGCVNDLGQFLGC